MDDTRVKSVDFANIQRKCCYLAFYEKRSGNSEVTYNEWRERRSFVEKMVNLNIKLDSFFAALGLFSDFC